jgi:hypothetical protein
MQTIWVFGDSFSEELNIKSINNARGGSDNYSIFESIWDCAEDIKDNDIIINIVL